MHFNMTWLRKVFIKTRPILNLKISVASTRTFASSPVLTRLFIQPKDTKIHRMVTDFSEVSYQAYGTSAAAVKNIDREGLSINIKGEWRYLNYVWLRDNCRCDKCYSYETFQKIILPSDINPNIQPTQVTSDDQSLSVLWPDGHESKYDLEWLQKHSNPGSEESITSQLLWNKDIISKEFPDDVPYEKFMSSDLGVKELLHSLLRYGIGVVKGAPTDIKETKKVAERVCHIQATLFSPTMWSFSADGARSDTAYTSIALGAHTDSTYFSLPCGIQVFHKLYHDGEGGETLLVDGFYAAEKLRNNKPDSFDILCEHRVEHQYKEQGKVHVNHDVVSLAPILKTHPVTGALEWIRYNHYDRTPIRTVPPNQLPAYYEALRDLSQLIDDPKGQYWLPLAPGSVLFVDNWRVLHGRASFTGKRKVCGCYLPRDDWMSRARTLGLLK